MIESYVGPVLTIITKNLIRDEYDKKPYQLTFQHELPNLRQVFFLSCFFVNFVSECKITKMYPLNLPHYAIKLGGTKDKLTIFDILRRRYVALTPEEWVRQHFIHYLIEHKHYPATLLANEIRLNMAGKTLRADSVLYDSRLRPRMIIEYKAPSIPITQKVFDQIATYNLLLHVDYLIVSNGIDSYCCKMDYESKKCLYLDHIPEYENI